MDWDLICGAVVVNSIFQKLAKQIKYLFLRNKTSAFFEIYTDGSLKKGRGAWAYVIVQNGQVTKESFGVSKNTTCTRMEFEAAIQALRFLPQGATATVYADSRILVDTMTLWLREWKKNNWTKKAGQDIPGVDQMIILDELSQQHSLSWRWIKAHSGIVFNERCDQLCIEARTKKILS